MPLVFRSITVVGVIIVMAPLRSHAEEPEPRPPDRSWIPIWAGLEVNNKWLLDSNKKLAIALSRIEGEHERLAHDVANVNAEVESLDVLLQQMEAQHASYKKQIAALYQTNIKLREKLIAKPK